MLTHTIEYRGTIRRNMNMAYTIVKRDNMPFCLCFHMKCMYMYSGSSWHFHFDQQISKNKRKSPAPTCTHKGDIYPCHISHKKYIYGVTLYIFSYGMIMMTHLKSKHNTFAYMNNTTSSLHTFFLLGVIFHAMSLDALTFAENENLYAISSRASYSICCFSLSCDK